MVYMYILRILQYSEIESNCRGVSNIEELRLYPLKVERTPLLFCSLIFVLFSIPLFLYSLSAFLYHILNY